MGSTWFDRARALFLVLMVIAVGAAVLAVPVSARGVAIADPGRQSSSPAVSTWRILLLVYRETDTDYVDSGGVTRHLRASLPQSDIDALVDAFQGSLSAAVREWSSNQAAWDVEVQYPSQAITRVASLGSDSRWVDPSCVSEAMAQYYRPGYHDMVMVYWRSSDDLGNSIPSVGWGWGSLWTANMGYVTVTYPGWTLWNPAVADMWTQVWIHEWLHAVCFFYEGLGYRLPTNGPDGAGTHGYVAEQPPFPGWGTFYSDMMNNRVLESGALTGIPAEAWSRATIRGPNADTDSAPPTTTASGADALWHNAPVTIILSATDNADGSGMSGGLAKTEYKLDSSAWTTGTSVTVAAPAGHANDGEHAVSYRSTDAAGNTETAKSLIVKIDTTAPSGSFSLAAGAATTTTTAVSGDSSVSDPHGPLEMRFSADNKSSWSSWSAYAATASLTLPSGLGPKTVVAQYRDSAGNVLELSDSVELVEPARDSIAPSTTASGADALWHNTAVTITFTASDNEGGSGVALTEYRVDSSSWTTGASVTIAAPSDHSNDGEHTVSYRSRDVAGNAEAVNTLTVMIDTIAPSGSFRLAGGSSTTTTTAVSGDSSISDAHGPLSMRFSTDNKASWSSWSPYTFSSALTLPAGLGSKTVVAQYRDAAGNVLELSDSIELVAPDRDVTAPLITLSGAVGGAYYRTDRLITLLATDAGSGVAWVRYTLDGRSQTFPGASAVVTVPAFPNVLHSFSYSAADLAGNVSQLTTITFVTDTLGPRTAAQATSGRVGKAILLRYRASDALSSLVWNCKLVVKSTKGKSVKTFATSAARDSRWHSVTWRPTTRGTYRYYVYAQDEAGNPQGNVASAKVVVK